MAIDEKQKQSLIATGEQVLEALNRVFVAAQGALEGGEIGSRSALSAPSNMMAGDARPERFLHSLNADQRDHLHRLLLEPFVARVEVEWQDARSTQTIYFARRSAVGLTSAIHGAQFISSGAALGHLAEFEAGDIASIALNGRTRTARILARAVINPAHHDALWDAVVRNFERVPFGEASEFLQYDSLRQALAALRSAGKTAPEDVVGLLRQQAAASVQERQRVRRKVVDRIALRDRPILNKFQGEIFRLPLDRQVLLFGPPGSGKTTTLIKRLAQKRTSDALSDEERGRLTGSLADDLLRADSWAMFSPSDLLRQYLGNAFNKEGVPDAGNVRTWDKERHDLARNALNILRSNRAAGFQLDTKSIVLSDSSSAGIARLHDAFVPEVETSLLKRCEEAISNLLEHGDEGSKRQAVRLRASLVGNKKISLEDVLRVFGQSEGLQEEIRRLAGLISANLDQAANLLLNRHKGLLDEIAIALPSIKATERELDAEEEDDDAEPAEQVGSTRVEALTAFMAALRNWARAVADGRTTVGKQTRHILDLVGDRMLPDDHFNSIGANIAMRLWLRTLVRAPRTFVLGVPGLYGRFRRQQIRDGRHFRSDEASSAFVAKNMISGDEVDVLLLVMLKNARRVLQTNDGRLLQSTAPYDWLEQIKSRYLTQVFVDEATDLSAVQLACTIELADPRLRSWFACGDLRQRVTANGLQNEEEIDWLKRTTNTAIDLRKVDIGYRQSRRLRDLSDGMANLFAGASLAKTAAPPGAEEADVWPLLSEERSGKVVAKWLAQRIQEVEKSVGWLPSIAIFVDGDELIDPLLQDIVPILAEQSIQIVGCKEGKVVGDEREVRIFDIQHIKGLEFEAVFFVGIDRMAERMPDLFERYLYVGLTRAATYLGITCRGRLPSKLDKLRRYFGPMPGWTETAA